MGFFNTEDKEDTYKARSQVVVPLIKSHTTKILSGQQLTKAIDKPDWSIVICTIRFYAVRVSASLYRDHINIPYTVYAWGDIPKSTSNWKYQYVAQVLLRPPTDNNNVTLRLEGAGYFTLSAGATPSSWSSRDNNSTYRIECFHVL